jgi:hypothetical protein
MAYTKTVWVNDSTPFIDEDNLNANEQGIFNGNVKAGETKPTNVVLQAITLDDSSYTQAPNDILGVEVSDKIEGGAITLNVNANGDKPLQDSNGLAIESLNAGIHIIAFKATYYEYVGEFNQDTFLEQLANGTTTPVTVGIEYTRPVGEILVEGNTLNNAPNNGNFINGVVGWTGVNAVLSESLRILDIIGDGGGLKASGIQDTGLQRTGQTIFAMMRARTTNSVSTDIKLGVGSEDIIQTNPIENQWYILSDIVTMVNDNVDLFVTLNHFYVDAGTANGKLLEVDADFGVFLIDMDALGIESNTKQQMLDLIGGYFEGLTSVFKPLITSIGKNIFNDILEVGDIATGSGLNVANPARMRNVGFVKIEPNTQYIVASDDVNFESIFEYDSSQTWIQTVSAGVFTTTANTRYVRGRALSVDLDSRIQIERGSVATVYEKHKDDIISTTRSLTLARATNGTTFDTLTRNGGALIYTQNVDHSTYLPLVTPITKEVGSSALLVYPNGTITQSSESNVLPTTTLGVSNSDRQQAIINSENISWIKDDFEPVNNVISYTTSITLTLADAFKFIEMDSATPVNVTIPLDASVDFLIGTQIDIVMFDGGDITIVPTGGIILRAAESSTKLETQYKVMTLKKLDVNDWSLIGAEV